MTEPTIEAFVFARGGSKGVPRKNVKLLAGKPLIAHAIECGQKCPSLGQINVSTDDHEIAEIAKEFGAHIPFMRPADLAGDQSSEWLAWRHAVETFASEGRAFDMLVSLPTTSPFRSVDDVEACISILKQQPEIDAVITVRKAERSPYFNMVTIAADGTADLVIKPSKTIERRQDAPAVFDMTTVAYAVRTELIMTADSFFDGSVRAVEVPPERALDIDTSDDFKLAEWIAETSVPGDVVSAAR